MWPDKETDELGKTDINALPWSPSLRRAMDEGPRGLVALLGPPPRLLGSVRGHTSTGRTLAEGMAREARASHRGELRPCARTSWVRSPRPPRALPLPQTSPRPLTLRKFQLHTAAASQRKLGPHGRRRAAGNSHAVPGTRTSPHRAELPTPAHTPQAGPRFPPAPSYLPAWAGEPRAGGARPGESCRELCLGKVGGTAEGGAGPEQARDPTVTLRARCLLWER